eukprot:1432439-Rhodomonas_salina.1
MQATARLAIAMCLLRDNVWGETPATTQKANRSWRWHCRILIMCLQLIALAALNSQVNSQVLHQGRPQVKGLIADSISGEQTQGD